MFEKLNLRNTLFKIINFRDFLIISGLISLGWGIYIAKPWLSFTVCGGLAIILGLLMQAN